MQSDRDELVREALKQVVDPELHLNIVDLGLIYDVAWYDSGQVEVTMTLTTPGCPVGSLLRRAVERTVAQLPGVQEVEVTLTFEPRWSPDFVSPAGRAALGRL